VNTTFRIQALTRSLGSDVVVSSDFLNGWKDGRKYCRGLGTHELKGRKATVDLYAVEETPDLFLR
jgi:class 3 adenylate cyclase